jgi:hypothetical protein
MFQLPSGFAADFASSTSGVLAALSPIYTPVLAVLLGALAIGVIISFMHHK